MENERVYASQQLICMLPSLALKVMLYLLNWQKFEVIKYYEKQMTDFMHISKEELDVAIQTLSDNNLIFIAKTDGQWCFELNKENIKKYFNVSMDKVKESEGLKMSSEVTWNKEKEDDMYDMTDDEIERTILMLKARLNERQQMKKVVVTAEPKDDLPW